MSTYIKIVQKIKCSKISIVSNLTNFPPQTHLIFSIFERYISLAKMIIKTAFAKPWFTTKTEKGRDVDTTDERRRPTIFFFRTKRKCGPKKTSRR